MEANFERITLDHKKLASSRDSLTDEYKHVYSENFELLCNRESIYQYNYDYTIYQYDDHDDYWFGGSVNEIKIGEKNIGKISKTITDIIMNNNDHNKNFDEYDYDRAPLLNSCDILQNYEFIKINQYNFEL